MNQLPPSLVFLVVFLPTCAYSSAGCTGFLGLLSGSATWLIGWGALENYLHFSDHNIACSRHMAHHREPGRKDLRDVDLQAMIPRFVVYLVLLAMYAGRAVALGQTFGLAVMYFNYETIHRLSHLSEEQLSLEFAYNTPAVKEPVLKMVLWHQKHHKAWGVNFGVTTPFWDIVSGTASSKTREWYPDGIRTLLVFLPVSKMRALAEAWSMPNKIVPMNS